MSDGIERLEQAVYGHPVSTDVRSLAPQAKLLHDAADKIVKAKEVLRQAVDMTWGSQGVAGWHRNGDLAAWGEFEWVDQAQALLDEDNNHA